MPLLSVLLCDLYTCEAHAERAAKRTSSFEELTEETFVHSFFPGARLQLQNFDFTVTFENSVSLIINVVALLLFSGRLFQLHLQHDKRTSKVQPLSKVRAILYFIDIILSIINLSVVASDQSNLKEVLQSRQIIAVLSLDLVVSVSQFPGDFMKFEKH